MDASENRSERIYYFRPSRPVLFNVSLFLTHDVKYVRKDIQGGGGGGHTLLHLPPIGMNPPHTPKSIMLQSVDD